MSTYSKPIRKNDNLLFILFFTLCSFVFFRPLAITADNNPVLKYVYFVLLLWVIFSSFSAFFLKNSYTFYFAAKLLVLSIACSIISANIYRGQDLFDSFLAAEYPVMGYVFYFYLLKRKVRVSSIEKIITIVGILFIIAFLISFAAYPKHLFEYNESLEDRGFQRILLTGSGFLFLLTFLALNKILVKRTLKWTVILFACYLCIVLSLTRVYILSTAVISLFYIWKNQGVFLKTMLLAASYVLITVASQLTVTQRLLTKTQDDTEDIQDYIRYQSAQYYLTDFQPSVLTRVIGNGFGYGDKSDYGRAIGQLQNQGYFVEDLGLLGLFIYLGIFAIIAYVIIFYRSFKTSLPPSFHYLKMYIMFLFLNGLTNSATFSEAGVLSIVFTLYLFDIIKNQERIMERTELAIEQHDEKELVVA